MKRFLLIPAAFALFFAVSAVAEDGLPRRSLRVFEAARLQPEVEETYEPSEYAAPAPMMYDDFPGYYPGYSSYRGLGFQGYCCEGQSPCTSRLWAGFCAAKRCGYDSWPLHGGRLSGLFSRRSGCASCTAKGSCDSGCTSCAVQKGEPVQKGGSVQKGRVAQKGFALRQPVVSQKAYVPQKTYMPKTTFVPQKRIVSQKGWATQKSPVIQKSPVFQKSPVMQKSVDCCPPAIGGGWGPTLPLCGRKHLLKSRSCDACNTSPGIKGKGGMISEPYYDYRQPAEAEVEEDGAEVLPPPPFEDRPTEFRPLPVPPSQDRSAQVWDWLRISPPAQSF